MQLYRKIKIVKKTEPFLCVKSNAFISYDVGETCHIVPQGQQALSEFRVNASTAQVLVDNHFAEYIDPAQVEQAQMPTKTQIDEAFTRLGGDLLQFEKERDLHRRCAEADLAAEKAYDVLFEQSLTTGDRQARYLSDTETEDWKRMDFYGHTLTLMTCMQEYKKTTDAQRLLQQEWREHQAERDIKIREDLLARLEYVKGFMADASNDYTQSSDGWTVGEVNLAIAMYRDSGSFLPQWLYVPSDIQNEWLTKARAKIESEKTHGE